MIHANILVSFMVMIVGALAVFKAMTLTRRFKTPLAKELAIILIVIYFHFISVIVITYLSSNVAGFSEHPFFRLISNYFLIQASIVFMFVTVLLNRQLSGGFQHFSNGRWPKALIGIYTALIGAQILNHLTELFANPIQTAIWIRGAILYGSYMLILLLTIKNMLGKRSGKRQVRESAFRSYNAVIFGIVIWLMGIQLLNEMMLLKTQVASLLLSFGWIVAFLIPVLKLDSLNRNLHPRETSFSLSPKGLTQFFDQYQLSKREQEIALLICAGKSNREIEADLYISSSTVKDHVYNIYRKTGIKNRVTLTNMLNQYRK